jgi:diacylglycerol kinase family enzyme
MRPGDSVAELAGAAIARGADTVGMAGGDGSQGLVAGVVAEHGVAMVVVPAGTRNHFAMDLGLDRGDVLGALDAFGTAVERSIDLGIVNGRTFVNNASLGMYARIIQSPEYRDGKVETVLGSLSDLVGPGAEVFDLRFAGPAGERHTRAHVLLVSNNAYGRLPATLASRPSLETGHLGVVAVVLPEDRTFSRAFTATAAAGREGLVPYHSWEASSFEVDSGGPIDVGIDGEALRMEPPLRFTISPRALRVRIPTHASGLSPAARRSLPPHVPRR